MAHTQKCSDRCHLGAWNQQIFPEISTNMAFSQNIRQNGACILRAGPYIKYDRNLGGRGGVGELQSV